MSTEPVAGLAHTPVMPFMTASLVSTFPGQVVVKLQGLDPEADSPRQGVGHADAALLRAEQGAGEGRWPAWQWPPLFFALAGEGAGFRGVAALAAAGALEREAGFLAVLAVGREAGLPIAFAADFFRRTGAAAVPAPKSSTTWRASARSLVTLPGQPTVLLFAGPFSAGCSCLILP